MGSSYCQNVRHQRHVNKIMITDVAGILETLGKKEKAEANDNLGDCYSINELCKKLECCIRAARKIVLEAIEDGMCEFAGKRMGVGIDGRRTKISVYRFKFKNTSKRSKRSK